MTTKLQNYHKIYQMAVIHPEWPLNEPTFSIARPSKITQIGIFVLKIYHLATLPAYQHMAFT
jgi:hypothetical protein